MNRNSDSINWSDELAMAVKTLGRTLLKFLGWVLSILMTLGLIGVITGTIVGGAFLLYTKNHLDTSVDDFGVMIKDANMTTMVSYVDENGKLVELTSERLNAEENRVWVKYSDMNKHISQAFIAIEDKRFEDHQGVDWIRTVYSTLTYFTGSDRIQGGSTITQQLIKNVTGDDDVTIQRKAKEIIMALNLEKKYDKTEILEMYLNNIYLSQGCYGVGAAAYHYFGKEVKDLTVIESAAIAAITQSPYKYDPIINPEFNAERRNTVIKFMYDQGRITKEEFIEAYGKELVLNVPDEDDDVGNVIHSWYTDAAQQEATKLLQDKFGYSAEFAQKMLLTGGYNIVTAMDPEIQAVVEDYYVNGDWERHDDSPIQPNSSCVIINPENGNVLALVGSRGEKTVNLGLNYATQTKRPPGSCIKPIAVYGPALETGAVTYGTVLDDAPINFGSETVDPDTGKIIYSRTNGYPQNSPKRYRGITTIHEGIRVSINTISWRTLERLGIENSFDFLTKKVGISTLVESEKYNGAVFTDKAFAPLAMGELTWGVTVKEITAAYQIFANGGIYNEERIVLKILDSNGEVVVDNEKKSQIVLSTENAYIMTKMMEEVVATGNARKITLKKTIDCAGKTGTTSNNNDRWFIGYTPYYLCGIWFGYSSPRSLGKFDATSTAPILAWDAIMTKITEKFVEEDKNGGEELKSFDNSLGVVKTSYCKDSGKLMTDACKADPRGDREETGYFKIGTEPQEYCDCHVLVDYDKTTKAIAVSGCCPSEDIIKVGLLNIFRELPFNIKIEDAQYTCVANLPEGYSYEGLTESMPYYQNLLKDGFATGYSEKKTVYFNHICTEHILNPVIPEVTLPPVTTIDPIEPLPDLNNGGEIDQPNN